MKLTFPLNKFFLSLSFISLFATALLPISLHAEVPVDESKLAQLAVQERGRKKPMTTLMQENLLVLSGSSTYKPNEDSPRKSSTSVMLDLWLQPDPWKDRPLILISSLALKEKLGLPVDRKLFSSNEIAGNPAFAPLEMESRRLRARDPKAELTAVQKEASQVAQRLELFNDWVSGHAAAIVPHPTSINGQWLPVEEITRYYLDDQAGPIQKTFSQFKSDWQQGRANEFQSDLETLIHQLSNLTPGEPVTDANGKITGYKPIYPSPHMLGFEYFYQTFHPFRWAWVAYALALIILALTSGWYRNAGYKLGWAFVLIGFGLQLFGFICRIIISGRPPVTDMYETVIWLAFGTVMFAIILEAIYRPRYFLLAATPVAILSLILADTQPTVLDSSIHPLVPVLRHNVWLIIHVLTITLSYAAFALALGLGHIVLGKRIAKSYGGDSALLYLYLYRALQIGVLLLATGTILGGVWANYSWGRFWDWDPKETWALTTLLCYLVLLHGRLCGWWGGFGLAVGSVLCFQAVLMAWYGVNFVLGKGLHSYGFGTGGYPFAIAFVVIELTFVAVALFMNQKKVAVKRS